jgi:hypothetical protein
VGAYLIELDCGGTRIAGGRCRADTDECRVADDCGEMGDTCDFARDPGQCDNLQIVGCGRPLMVADDIRTAAVVARDDWVTGSPSLQPPDAETRAHLADYWTSIAQLEHASVASFARFSLQMMALGAPPDILVEAQQAAADEIEHARLAYGLASGYGGASVGPAPYDLTGVTLDTDPRAILASLIEEACLGEILGTAEANACAELAQDPTVIAVYRRIAADEAVHAALAWRTLKWLLEAHPELRPQASTALRVAIESHFGSQHGRTKHLPQHGVLGTEARRTLHREAVESVLIPCAEALGLTVGYVV